MLQKIKGGRGGVRQRGAAGMLIAKDIKPSACKRERDGSSDTIWGFHLAAR